MLTRGNEQISGKGVTTELLKTRGRFCQSMAQKYHRGSTGLVGFELAVLLSDLCTPQTAWKQLGPAQGFPSSHEGREGMEQSRECPACLRWGFGVGASPGMRFPFPALSPIALAQMMSEVRWEPFSQTISHSQSHGTLSKFLISQLTFSMIASG